MAASKNITLFSLSPSDRGNFVTKKEARTQIREALSNAGLKLGLFTKVNKIVNDRVIDVFTAPLTIDEKVLVSAVRGVGNPVTINVTKAKLKKLIAAAKAAEAEKAEAKAKKPKASKPAPKAEPTPVVTEDAGLPTTLADFVTLGMDQAGELLGKSPRKGGLTVAQLREIVAADDVDPKGMSREELIEFIVGGMEFLASPVDMDEDDLTEICDELNGGVSNILTLSSIMADMNI